MPRSPTRRRAARDGHTREVILDAAEQLIGDDGYDATSTSSIAQRAGVPKGLVFYYFPAKTEILHALLSERLPTDPLTDVTAIVTPGDPAQSLVDFDAAVNRRDRHAPLLRLILWREADTHPDVSAHLRLFRSYVRDATVRILQASVPYPVQPGTLQACATAWVAATFSTRGESRDELGSVARVVAAGMVQLG